MTQPQANHQSDRTADSARQAEDAALVSPESKAAPAKRGRKKKDGPKAVAMVTARMTTSKKDEATRVLKDLGYTPSDAINQLFDFVVREHRLPFGESVRQGAQPDKAEVKEALAFVSSLAREDRFEGTGTAGTVCSGEGVADETTA